VTKTKSKVEPYRIVEEQDLGLSVAIIFKARGLPRWKIFIRKNEYSPELVETRIREEIKRLKKQLKKMYKEYTAELTKVECNVLWSLAVQGPCSSAYELAKRKINERKKLGDPRTLKKVLQSFSSLGLVKVSKPRNARGGTPCELTTKGLFTLLNAEWPELLHKLDNIAYWYKSKVPLIFGNWEEFKSKGDVNEFVIRVLDYFKNSFHSHISSFNLIKQLQPTKLTENILAKDLTRHVILPYIFPYIYELFLPRFTEVLDLAVTPEPHREEIQSWFKTVSRYSNLRDWLSEELKRLEYASKEFLKVLKEWDEILKAQDQLNSNT